MKTQQYNATYNFLKYENGQYKNDVFRKLNFNFQKGKKIIDIGCGWGVDAEIFINEYKLQTYGLDIYKHKRINTIKGLKFVLGNIYKIPFRDSLFDYVFLHDVLMFIDKDKRGLVAHVEGLRELKRVCKKEGYIIVVEANRFNPLFYPHMVLWGKRNHIRQGYFQKLIRTVFKDVEFKYFEAHVYPSKLLRFFKVYERIMEKFSFLRPFIAYNVAIIKTTK